MSGRLMLMSSRELRPCRTFCPAEFNTHKMSDKENKNDQLYLPVINWGKCLTAAQNVRQGAEGLPDILSGTPEIIFAITVTGVARASGPSVRYRSLFMTGGGGSESNDFLWKIFSRRTDKKFRSLLNIVQKNFDAHSYTQLNLDCYRRFITRFPILNKSQFSYP